MAQVIVLFIGKNRLKQAVLGLLGFGLVVAAVGAIGVLIVLAIRAGATFAAALLAAVATVGAAVIVRGFERRRVMEAIRREQLTSIYSDMAQFLHGLDMPEPERIELVDNFLRKSLVYASPTTLKAYRSWFTQLPDTEDWPIEAYRPNFLRYEAFVKAMRKDLGISNWGLNDGDLTRLRVSDFDEFP